MVSVTHISRLYLERTLVVVLNFLLDVRNSAFCLIGLFMRFVTF